MSKRSDQRRCVVFESGDFNTTVTKENYLNPECFGDDLAEWFNTRLEERNLRIRPIGQEDFGWYTTFIYDDEEYNLVISHVGPRGNPEWVVEVERNPSLLKSLFGASTRSVPEEALLVVDEIVKTSPSISTIRWLRVGDAHRGHLEGGSESPVSP